jgi:hypothetical protein
MSGQPCRCVIGASEEREARTSLAAGYKQWPIIDIKTFELSNAFRDCSLRIAILRMSPYLKWAANGEMEVNAQATKLQAVENDLKQLMVDVTRAMEKAQEAVARIASKAATPTTETESTSSSSYSAS